MMSLQSARIGLVCVGFGACFVCASLLTSQEPPPVRLEQEPAQKPGEVPKGVEVLARGPVHEAFASPTTEPKATPQIAKKPPLPIDEMPPEERPEGDVAWIGGYWAFDDDRTDFLWVSGCWRTKPDNKEWVPGYWREVGANWQWVPGFWATVQGGKAQNVTYYPDPPAPPNVAAGDAPGADTFYIPGYWSWTGERYVWRAGYWTRVRPGYIYVPSHYRWTPYGHVFVAGYWDYAVARRGVLYAPVSVDVVLVGPRYVHTPYYAIRDTIVLDTLFVRPAYGAYYFGDYYGPRYVAFGFEPCVVYSRRHYEPIIVYERWHHREDPRWFDARLTLVVERNAGRAPVPPRTLVQQTTIIQNTTNVTNVTNVIAPTTTVVKAGGGKVVQLDKVTRQQVAQASATTQQALAVDRKKTESTPVAPGALTKPRTTALSVPTTPTVNAGGVSKTPMGAGNITKDGTTTVKDGKGLPARDASTIRDGSKTTPALDAKTPARDTVVRDASKMPPRDRPTDSKKSDDKKKKN